MTWERNNTGPGVPSRPSLCPSARRMFCTLLFWLGFSPSPSNQWRKEKHSHRLYLAAFTYMVAFCEHTNPSSSFHFVLKWRLLLETTTKCKKQQYFKSLYQTWIQNKNIAAAATQISDGAECVQKWSGKQTSHQAHASALQYAGGRRFRVWQFWPLPWQPPNPSKNQCARTKRPFRVACTTASGSAVIGGSLLKLEALLLMFTDPKWIPEIPSLELSLGGKRGYWVGHTEAFPVTEIKGAASVHGETVGSEQLWLHPLSSQSSIANLIGPISVDKTTDKLPVRQLTKRRRDHKQK